jgi:eukaryotic-like serine/threonine-protein kinase
MSEESWNFEQGDEVVPGRIALEKMGGGITYETYLGWDERLFSTVVLKIIRPDQTDSSTALRHLSREAQILGELNHPVVLRCFDTMPDGARPHLVLEYLEGDTLGSLLRFGTLPLEQLIPLAISICSALHYLHGENLVHLDVKPSNIVMGVPPRLIDFSIARTVEKAKELDTDIGSQDYMAPEQCLPGKRGTVQPASDMWGLGATLYKALLGRLPYPEGIPDHDDPEIEYPQLVEKPELPPLDIPEPLVGPLMACLEDDPSDRPSPAQLANELEPLLALLPTRPVLRRSRPKLR